MEWKYFDQKVSSPYYQMDYPFGNLVIQRQKYGKNVGKWHVYDSNEIFDPIHLEGDLKISYVKLEAVAMMNSKLRSLMEDLEGVSEY